MVWKVCIYSLCAGPSQPSFLHSHQPHHQPPLTHAQAAAAKAEEERKKALKALPVRNDPNAMKWETHTKGFASKYLAKFGFKVRDI